MENRAYLLADGQTIPITILKRYPEYSLVVDDEGRMYKAKNSDIISSETASKNS